MSKWWHANLGARLAFASRHPAYAAKSVVRDLLALDERFLGLLTGVATFRIKGFLSEPLRDPRFNEHLRSAQKQLDGVEAIGADLYAKRVLLQYAIVRAFRPSVVLETGIANGISSAYLLLAMERNQMGILHSIDVNDGSYLPAGKRVGWVVPEWLCHRWTVHLGDSREVLPQVLESVGTLDIFIHDSLHEYDHMKFEYEQAYPRIRPGGILVSDDAMWNRAFPEFARNVEASFAKILRGVGVLQRPNS